MTSHYTRPVQELVSQQQSRIDLIEQCANEAHAGEFERRWLKMIRRCGEWFSTLPLNPEIYREPGGAFRCTVETAFYAMRLAGGQKFGTNLPSEQRRRVEPQYNYAVFLAAMCTALDEPYRHFSVLHGADRTEWNPSVHGAAGPWLGSTPYYVNRRTACFPIQRMRTGMLAQTLIGQHLLVGLDATVLADLFGAINPDADAQGGGSMLQKVVRQATEVATEFDRKAQRAVFAPVQFAVPAAVHVVGAVAGALEPATTGPAPPSSHAPTEAPTDLPSYAPAHAPSPPGECVQAVTPSSPDSALPVTLCLAPVDTDAGAAQPEIAGSGSPSGVPSSGESAPSGPTAALRPNSEGIGIEAGAAGVVNPAEFKLSPPAGRVLPHRTPASTDADEAAFMEVLQDVPNMIRELFKALRQDVAGGRAKVVWGDTGLVLQKRLIGNYGVASETLVEHLNRRGLIVESRPGEVTLEPRAGMLILERQ